MVQFQHSYYLFALVLVPLMWVLYYFEIKRKKKIVTKIGDPVLVIQLIKNYSSEKFFLKFLFIVGAFIAGIIALANPRIPQGSTTINRSGIDIMIALDVSKSMLADDIKPNRLERAKQLITKLIDQLPNDRIGIVVFAGRAYLQMPLTSDHAAAKMYLATTSSNIVPTQGTVIGDALKMCNTAFDAREKKYKTILLISDGEDHDETAIKITKAMAAEGVSINTIGIGSPEGSTIIDPATNEIKKDAAGSTVITKLNETALKNIAANGNGLYQLFTNTDDVANNLNTQLKSMGQRAITENSLVNYKSYFSWFLIIALLVLSAEFFLTEIKLPTTKKKNSNKKIPATALLILLIPGFVCAQNDDAILKKGNDAYNKKDYAIAADHYKKVLENNAANEKAQYNLGNALYKNGNTEEALQAYTAAIKNTKEKTNLAAAWYNKGVAFQNSKQLPQCIDAYKNALRINPIDEDARLNLQKAIQQQQQQQQQDKQKPKDEPKKQQDKDKQPKPQQNRMTQKEAEEKLKALLQHEKNLQDKLKKVDVASPDKPEKDW